MLSSVDGVDVVGRRNLSLFINTTLLLYLNRIEDTASGCVACQLLDIMYLKIVPMSKISWTAHMQITQFCNSVLRYFTSIVILRLIDFSAGNVWMILSSSNGSKDITNQLVPREEVTIALQRG